MGSEYTHMIVNLLAILFLMIVFIVTIKKFRLSKFTNNNQIKVINSFPIGGKEKIILLEVRNKTILIGATSNHIETLHVFNESEEVEHAIEKMSVEKNNFSETMNSLSN